MSKLAKDMNKLSELGGPIPTSASDKPKPHIDTLFNIINQMLQDTRERMNNRDLGPNVQKELDEAGKQHFRDAGIDPDQFDWTR